MDIRISALGYTFYLGRAPTFTVDDWLERLTPVVAPYLTRWLSERFDIQVERDGAEDELGAAFDCVLDRIEDLSQADTEHDLDLAHACLGLALQKYRERLLALIKEEEGEPVVTPPPPPETH